jgi:hypothetical protein
MEPASKRLRVPTPVLPLDLIRPIIRLRIEADTYKEYCLEGHRMRLTFGGQLVLEDIQNYIVHRTREDICSKRLVLWKREYPGEYLRRPSCVNEDSDTAELVQYFTATLEHDWKWRFDYYIGYNQYAISRIVDDIMLENDY